MGGLEGKDDIQVLEMKLRNQISDVYRQIKLDCIRFCQIKAKKYLDEQTQYIRRNIQQASYESLDRVQDDLSAIKQDYLGPKFPGYEILIAEVTS